MNKPMVVTAIVLSAGTTFAADKTLPGSEGTTTSWESDKPLLVEVCDRDESGSWDYPTCARTLRSRTQALLCDRGPGTYKWAFQVGAEKSKLNFTTKCGGR